MKFEKRLVFLFAMLISVSMGCDFKSGPGGGGYPNSLIVLPSASGVQESEIANKIKVNVKGINEDQ